MAVLAGCGTGEQISDDMAPPGDGSSSLPPSQSQGQVEFVTRTDTVDVLRTDGPAATDSLATAGVERFAIQIGAFKDPQNAISFQNLTRERYHLPMSNEFNAGLGFYQIRIGAFASREEAQAHVLRMQADFPLDYKDCWIVQVTR